NCVKLSISLLTRHAGFEKGVAFDPTRAPVFQLVTGRVERLLHGGRHPKAEGIANKGAVKSFRCDADDRVLNAIKDLSSANDVRVAAVTIFPRLITDHRHWMRVAPCAFFRSESAAENRLDPECVEII